MNEKLVYKALLVVFQALDVLVEYAQNPDLYNPDARQVFYNMRTVAHDIRQELKKENSDG